MRHNQIFPGTSLTKTAKFVDNDGFAVDPTAVTFKTYSPYGDLISNIYPSATVTRDAVGSYAATYTPAYGGVWHWRWEIKSGTPTLATEGSDTVQCSPFEDGGRDAYES